MPQEPHRPAPRSLISSVHARVNDGAERSGLCSSSVSGGAAEFVGDLLCCQGQPCRGEVVAVREEPDFRGDRQPCGDLGVDGRQQCVLGEVRVAEGGVDVGHAAVDSCFEQVSVGTSPV